VPMSRGCITVMEGNFTFTKFLENKYAANAIKHCIRPQDMTGKSAALILRQMHPSVVVSSFTFNSMIRPKLIYTMNRLSCLCGCHLSLLKIRQFLIMNKK